MSTPTIAVETNSRPAGSSMKATGAAATSQAARQTAGRASRLPASARVTRPSAASPRACSRSVSDIRCRSRVELSRSSSEESTRASTANSCSSLVAEAAGRARERGEAADARVVRQLERHAEVGDGGELVLEVEARVDRVPGDVVAAARRRRPRPSGRRRSRAAASPGWPAGRSSRRRGCRRSGARCGRGRGARGTASRPAAAARAGRARSASRPRTTGRRRSSRQRQS